MAASDFAKIAIGEGKLYVGDTFATAVELGFTRGATFNDNKEIRHIPVDGKPGNITGDAIYQTSNPTLEITTMVMDASNLEETFFGVTVTADTPEVGDTTLKTTTANPVDADYKTFWWVGKLKDGQAWQIKLKNAIGVGPMSLTFNDKSEVEIPAVIECNFTSVDDTELPYEMILFGA